MLASMLGLAVGVYAIQSSLTIRLEEVHGMLEQELATPQARVGWLLKRLAVTGVAALVLLAVGGAVFGLSYGASVSDYSWVPSLTGAVLVYAPAVAIMMGLVVCGLGWWPRAVIPVSWAVVGAFFLLILVSDALNLPAWVLDVLPFTGTPYLPYEAMNWGTFAIFTVVAAVLWVIGLVGFRRRDIPA